MNANGTGQTRLTSSAGIDGLPAWSADGRRIAIASARNGNSEIYAPSALAALDALPKGMVSLSNAVWDLLYVLIERDRVADAQAVLDDNPEVEAEAGQFPHAMFLWGEAGCG